MPSREDLGTAHLDPPLARVTLAARQPDLAWKQRAAPGPDGRQRHMHTHIAPPPPLAHSQFGIGMQTPQHTMYDAEGREGGEEGTHKH